MKKTTRAEKAQETLAIIDRGFYQVNGEQIDVKKDITYSVYNSLLYRPDDFDALLQDVATGPATLKYHTKIKVVNSTVLEAAAESAQQNERVGCLNFAFPSYSLLRWRILWEQDSPS